MKINASDFEYVLCPGSMPDEQHRVAYEKVYKCWEAVWVDAFQELGVKKSFTSDSFTRQDYVGALFHKGTCFAMGFFRWTDAKSAMFANDSYFYNWSPEHLKKLSSRGPRVIVCSYFTVHPYGRGETLGISGKELLMGMIVETFMGSAADSMTGAVRINKGVNKAGLNWGAQLIDQNISSGYGDANVDLIGFFKDEISKHEPHELKFFAQQLWKNRKIIPRQQLQNEFVTLPRLKRVA